MKYLTLACLAGLSLYTSQALAAEQWKSKVYTKGNQVCLNGDLYQAKWWAGPRNRPSRSAPRSRSHPNWGHVPWLPLKLNSAQCGASSVGDSQYRHQVKRVDATEALQKDTTFAVEVTTPSTSNSFDCKIPNNRLLPYMWAFQLGKCINANTDIVKVGEKKPNTGEIKLLWSKYRNLVWAKNTNAQVNYRIKPKQPDNEQVETLVLHKKKLIEVDLDKTNVKEAPASQLVLTNIRDLVRPNEVDLTRISISSNKLRNKTPYTLEKLNLRLNGRVHVVELSPALPAYSQASIPSKWQTAKVMSLETLSSSAFNYKGKRDHKQTANSRLVNEVERANSEKAQIYDRYFMNSPQTLAEITEHFATICSDNKICRQYDGTYKNYVLDTYFAKSVSGLKSSLWIDKDVWGLATVKPLSSTEVCMHDNKSTIWMHPNLMGYMQTGSYRRKIEGWQALIHEYYHNHGFHHDSGWPSGNGIDDLFGKKVVDDYLPTIGTNYVSSDIAVVDSYDSRTGTYLFNLFGDPLDIDTLSLRLLSTSDLHVKITQHNSNQIGVKFLKKPTAGVYVSVYSNESEQMATVRLDLIKEINTNVTLARFNQDIGQLLKTYEVINVTTADGAWTRDFRLPSRNVAKGRVINFTHRASYSSTIHHDGTRETIRKGQSRRYEFNGSRWVRR